MSKNEKQEKESKLSKFKEIWANPRYKALIKLGMYALFFASLFFISYISSNFRSKPIIDNDVKDNAIVPDNYNYVYEININSKNVKETITYTGIETKATNSGTIEYSNLDGLYNYVVDKTINKIYINGVEKEKLYEELYEDYLSYKSIKEIINNSKKQDDKNYIYIDKNGKEISITVIENDKKLSALIRFPQEENIEEYYIETIKLEFSI